MSKDTYLLKTNVSGIFSEALPANVQSIFANKPMPIRTGTATTKLISFRTIHIYYIYIYI